MVALKLILIRCVTVGWSRLWIVDGTMPLRPSELALGHGDIAVVKIIFITRLNAVGMVDATAVNVFNFLVADSDSLQEGTIVS